MGIFNSFLHVYQRAFHSTMSGNIFTLPYGMSLLIDFIRLILWLVPTPQNWMWFHWTHGQHWVICEPNPFLVGGLVAIFYCSINIGLLIIPIDDLIFFRGVFQPPTRFDIHLMSILFKKQNVIRWSPPITWHKKTAGGGCQCSNAGDLYATAQPTGRHLGGPANHAFRRHLVPWALSFWWTNLGVVRLLDDTRGIITRWCPTLS